MFRKEPATLGALEAPADQEVAVAYFLEGKLNDETKAPEAGPLNVAQQRKAVLGASVRAGLYIAANYIDFETESDTNRPGLRQLLDEAREAGITRCIVANKRYVADHEGSELFWTAMFNMTGVTLIEAQPSMPIS